MILVPPAIAAAVAGVLIAALHPDDRPDLTWSRRLARVTGGIAFIVIALAAIGIIGIPFRYADPLADLAAIVGRLAGVAIAIAVIRLCRESADSG